MALMSLRSRSHVKSSIVLTRADNLCTLLYNITSKYYCKTYFNGLDNVSNPHPTSCVFDVIAN